MTSIGVVVLRNNKSILQDSVTNTNNINNNENDNKRREFIIVRKKPKASLPATVSVTSLVQAVEGSLPKKPKLDDGKDDSGRTPAPLAVARRNARERNRVRQVNNGFSALRRHIPDEVAEAFESANSNRGSHKKLSKVETLRMAVEYIRSLESLLNIGESSNKENGRPSLDSFPSPASSSPRDTSYDPNYFSMNSPALDDDEFDEDDFETSLPTFASQHFTNISETENFQLMSTPHMYEEDENGQPMTPSSDLLIKDDLPSPHILDRSYQFGSTPEPFTVIHPEPPFAETEPGLPENTQIDIKYAETLRLAEIQASFGGNSDFVNLSLLNSHLLSASDQSKLNIGDNNKYIESNDVYDGVQLKQELPDVTPEDKQQFEETLKWWQEKTKQGTFLKSLAKQ